MQIRQADSSDIPAVKACAEAAYSHYIERIGKPPAPMVADFATQAADGILWVVADGADVGGFVVFYPRGDHMHLENVAVSPHHQGKGLGKRLIVYVEDAGRAAGLAAVELYTNEKMTENLSIYPMLGYRETGRRYEDGFNRIYFRKDLQQP